MDENRTQAVESHVEPPIVGPGAHLRDHHRQDQLDRLDRRRRRLCGSPWLVSGRLVQVLWEWPSPTCSTKGVGIWGINIPIGWGFAIVNFVWWIGIGHAGTLISAILLLLKQIVAKLDQPFR